MTIGVIVADRGQWRSSSLFAQPQDAGWSQVVWFHDFRSQSVECDVPISTKNVAVLLSCVKHIQLHT
jgi:hypothetical protein